MFYYISFEGWLWYLHFKNISTSWSACMCSALYRGRLCVRMQHFENEHSVRPTKGSSRPLQLKTEGYAKWQRTPAMTPMQAKSQRHFSVSVSPSAQEVSRSRRHGNGRQAPAPAFPLFRQSGCRNNLQQRFLGEGPSVRPRLINVALPAFPRAPALQQRWTNVLSRWLTH